MLCCRCAPETGLCDVSVEYVDSSGWEAHVVTDLVSVGPVSFLFVLLSSCVLDSTRL